MQETKDFALKRKKKERESNLIAGFDSRQYERSCGLLSLGSKEMQDGGWGGSGTEREEFLDEDLLKAPRRQGKQCTTPTSLLSLLPPAMVLNFAIIF